MTQGRARVWLLSRRLTMTTGAAATALTIPALMSEPGRRVAATLELRGGAAVAVEWWRLLTGHLVHFSGPQLFFNLLAFVWLGSLCEPRMRRRYGSLLIVSALTVSLMVLMVHGDFTTYRGLSGVASAQFAALVALRWRESGRTGGIGAALPCLVSFLLFLGKTAWEIETGRALFAGSLGLGAAGASPVAHLTGALSGLAVALWHAPPFRRLRPQFSPAPASPSLRRRGPVPRLG